MNATTVTAFAELDHFVGFDWAEEKHDVVAVDRDGKVVLTLAFPDTAEGWARLREKLAPLGQLGVAIETRRGPAVERLLEAGWTVFPMNPKAAERFRDRKAPSGVKDDTLDAWSFADALRSDGHAWRPLRPEDPQTQLLRILCRDEIGLIEPRTALALQLRQALRCLGQRWLKIVWRMWRDRTPYDEALHMRSLAKSGSWVIGLLPPPQPAASVN